MHGPVRIQATYAAILGSMAERRIAVADLRLDEQNPRLPEDIRETSQPEILEYLFESAVLDELARSYIDNGFFAHEPLIVTPHEDEPGAWVVLEGNRRLAALKVLLRDEDTQAVEDALSFDFEDELSAEDRADLLAVPAFPVASRDEVRKYLGFRHIGGIKTWSAEAKARYLADEVELASHEPNPFLDVSRRVGSNVQGVRNAYLAISILRHAREEWGVPVSAVQRRRFGVWTRAMNSPLLREYIGLGDPRSYRQVRESLEHLNEAHLREVLRDLIPQKGRKKPLLSDSRDVTVYALALQSEQARAALREYGDFELARQIVSQANLPDRLDRIARSLNVLLKEVTHAEELDRAVLDAAVAVAQVSDAVATLARSKV